MRACFAQLFKVLVAGVGFLSDAYDLFVINTVLVVLKYVYPQTLHGEATVATAAVAGSVIGQIAFGFAADKIGRRRGFILTMCLVIAGSVASCMAFHTDTIPIYTTLAVCRFFLGVGIGGEYPLSATISSESSAAKRRGTFVACVFSMQGLGMLLAPLMGIIVLSLLPGKLDIAWRVLVGITSLPGFVMLYWRCKMEETEAFTKSQKNVNKWPIIRRNWKRLVGTAGCWCLFDISFYSQGLFSTTIIEETHISVGDSHNAVLSATQLNLLLVLIALPGYYCGVALIDRIGRRKLQMGGFIGMTITFLLMGAFMETLEQNVPLFFLLYGLSFFFSNAGPNTTTFVLPSELFPAEIRATCHGLSAAAGKLGAVIGGAALRPVMDGFGLSAVMYFCGIAAILGLIMTYFFIPEPLGRSLDDLGVPKGSRRDHGGVAMTQLSTRDRDDDDADGAVHPHAVGISLSTDSVHSPAPSDSSAGDGAAIAAGVLAGAGPDTAPLDSEPAEDDRALLA